MPARWSKETEVIKFKELHNLYVSQNKPIGEIGMILNLAEATVYDRLLRLGIKPNRSAKTGFNCTSPATIPYIHTRNLAEFFGVMLGDGCLTPTQVTITLGNKELSYVKHVSILISKLFNVTPKIHRRPKGYYVVYFGSKKLLSGCNQTVLYLIKLNIK